MEDQLSCSPSKNNISYEFINKPTHTCLIQVGEKTHMKTAIIAASRAKHQQIHNPNSQPTDTEALKEKLQNTRKLKLEHKLVSIH